MVSKLYHFAMFQNRQKAYTFFRILVNSQWIEAQNDQTPFFSSSNRLVYESHKIRFSLQIQHNRLYKCLVVQPYHFPSESFFCNFVCAHLHLKTVPFGLAIPSIVDGYLICFPSCYVKVLWYISCLWLP